MAEKPSEAITRRLFLMNMKWLLLCLLSEEAERIQDVFLSPVFSVEERRSILTVIKFFLICRLCSLILGLQNRPVHQCLASSKIYSTKSASARQTLKRSNTICPEMCTVALSVYYFLFQLLGCFEKSNCEIESITVG
jgi:hypothetical protein